MKAHTQEVSAGRAVSGYRARGDMDMDLVRDPAVSHTLDRLQYYLDRYYHNQHPQVMAN